MAEEAEILEEPQVQDTPPQTGDPTPVLAPEHRQKLDSIVMDLYKKKAPKEVVQAIVNDFKTKYAKPVSAPQESSHTLISPVRPKEPDYLNMTGGVQQFTPSEADVIANDQHRKVVDEASSTIHKTLGDDKKLAALAQSMLADKKNAANKMLSDSRNMGEGSDISAHPTFPEIDFSVPKPEEVAQFTQAIKQDPGLQEEALIHAKKTNPKEAKDIDKALYVLHSSNRAVNGFKQAQISENANKISKGELEYNPRNGQLTKPEDFGESFSTSIKKRNEDMALFDLADNGTDEQLINKLDALVDKQDPDAAVPVPAGFGGHVGAFAGGQGKVSAEIAGAQALNFLAPGSGEVLSAGIYAHEMGRRAYATELQRSYAANIQAGLSKDKALENAKKQALTAMTIDATTAAVMGKTTGGSAAKGLSVVAKDAPKLAVEGGWYNGVIKNGFDFIKKESPLAFKNAALAGGGEIAKNISANAFGDKRNLDENVIGAAGSMAALHYSLSAGMALLGNGVKKSVGLSKKIMQGFTKVPLEDAKIIAKEQVEAGNMTPQAAADVVGDIESQKEIDKKIHSSVINDNVRLELHPWIEKLEAAKEEKKNVESSFDKETAQKEIDRIEEKIKEISSAPEAKIETPPEKPKVTVSTPNILNVKSKVAEFETESGSKYSVDRNSTTRDKSEHAGHGIGDSGVKSASDKTVYVSPEDLGKAQEIYLQGGNKKIEYEGNKVRITTEVNGKKRVTEFSVTSVPEIGKHPLEFFNDGAHLGNKIVNVKLKDNAPAIESPRTLDVGEQASNGETLGSGDTGSKILAGTQEQVSGNEKELPQGVGGEEKTVGIKNAKSNEIRGQFNLPKVDLPKMGNDVEVVNEGKRLVDSGEINPREVVARVLYKKEGVQPAEAKALQYYMHQLDAHESNLREQLHAAETPEGKAEVHGKLQQLSDEVDRATAANMISGTAWSNVGNIRQIVTDKGFNPSREKAFIKDAYGGEIPKDIQVKLDAIIKQRDEALAAKAKVEEELRQKMAVKGFEEVKKQAKRSAKNAETKEALKKEEEDLLNALRKAFKRDIGNANAGIPIPVETLEVLGKLAINYVKQGVNGLEALVDKLHANIGADSGLSKKEIRNAIAEYEPLQEVQESKRLNKKADLLEDKLTPTILKTKRGEVAGHSEPTDFNKPTRVHKEFRKSTEWVKAQQRVANAEYKIKIEKRKAFESKKNMYQKGLAWLGRGIRLSVLSGYNVLAKLTAAATIGAAGKRIPEQAIGAIYGGIFKGVAEKAPIEGGANVMSELKFYKEFFNPKKFAHNAWEILKSGSSDLSKRLGSAEYEHVPGLYLPTDLHQIIKDPPKRATFEASFRNGMIWAEKNGLDITDPLVINSIENASYKRAQYEIFQEQNWLSKKFTSWKSSLEKQGNTGSTAKFLVDFLIPVSTVPTNIARRVVTTSPLGLIRGSKEVIQAYRNGIEKLTPDQADHVMMQLKQGTLGTALWLIGWYGAKSFGGLYSKFNPDKKRREGEMTSDAMMIGGKMVPKPVQHALPLEIIQFAATARHIYDHSVKGESTPEALYHAGLGSIGGLVEQIPILETGAHLVGATSNKYEADKLKDDAIRRFEPQILRETGIIKKDAKKAKKSADSREIKR